MKRYLILCVFFVIAFGAQAQSDQELNRDSVVGWQYISNPLKANAVHKPIKSQYGTYSVWQQQASDMLIKWIQQSYLPRGLVMRTIAKNDDRWTVMSANGSNGSLHGYGVNFLGYGAKFVNGKIDLHCCEQGQKLTVGFNDFPGENIIGFNPGGLYFYAEHAQFTSGDDDAQLAKEGIDKKIQPNLYKYRTYLDHYHDAGYQMFKVGVVVPKNGEWPFKPVLVKDAVAYIQQQMAAYPGIMQKNPYALKGVQDALERLKPYYNEVAKLDSRINYNNAIKDGTGHYLLNPEVIINGKPINKTFPEYNILVSTTQQTVDQSKTDNPLWLYVNLTPSLINLQGNPAKFDPKFGTEIPHMVYSMLNNFNFDFAAKWLAQPDARKGMVYTPVKVPAKSTTNIFVVPVTVSATAGAKNKDPNTILYEDFDGYAEGTFSAKSWHTYGHNGHDFLNATLKTVNDRSGKWISIPNEFSFYPDFKPPLPTVFTINYDVYFGKDIRNKRTPIYFRIETYDKSPRQNSWIDLHDLNRNGFEFSIAMSGETLTNKRYMVYGVDEIETKKQIMAFKEKDIAHVSISVNGASVSVSVNGKEIMTDANALPAGKMFKRYGWYCNEPNMLLGNIYIKNTTPVK